MAETATPSASSSESQTHKAAAAPVLPGLRVAIIGCLHGELDKMYETIEYIGQKTGKPIELVLVCGDFQAVRNEGDLACLACPPKYRAMNTFYKYYSGEKKAPIPTVYIGGNHEASNYHLELFHGGWVAPNIYYMGAANVLRFAGLRIAGLTGIFKQHDFFLGHHECPPFDRSAMRSAYHIREYDVYRLMQLSGQVDVFLSHDWPLGIVPHGDQRALLRRKGFLAAEVQSNTLGSPPAERLMKTLKPRYWFAAHLHVKFPAVFRHTAAGSSVSATAAAGPSTPSPASAPVAVPASSAPASAATDIAAAAPNTSAKPGPGGVEPTKFLALDKCLPNRDFLQVLDFPEAVGPRRLEYDPEWLAIVRKTEPLLSLDYRPAHPLPNPLDAAHRPTPADLEEVRTLLEKARAQGKAASSSSSSSSSASSATASDPVATAASASPVERKEGGSEGLESEGQDRSAAYAVPLNFVPTAAPYVYDPRVPLNKEAQQPGFCVNPQTTAFLSLLGLPDRMADRFAPGQQQQQQQQRGAKRASPDGDRAEAEGAGREKKARTDAVAAAILAAVANPDEIDLDLDEEEEKGKEQPTPAAAASVSNPDEISLDDD